MQAVDLGDGHRLVIGRALIGRIIFHMRTSPFPASLELSEEVVGIGKNFEKIIDAYVDQVIQVSEKRDIGFRVWKIFDACGRSSHPGHRKRVPGDLG